MRKPAVREIVQFSCRVVSALLLFGLGVGLRLLPAQEPEDALTQYRNLGLHSADGAVPVFYSLGAENRALRYQKALARAYAFYSESLDVKAPFVLVVAEKGDWEKADRAPYPMPHNSSSIDKDGRVRTWAVLPARMEDFPFSEQMAPSPDLLAEAIGFHEVGHIVAYVLGIGSRNPWVNELIANFFMVGYIKAGHPEYSFMMAGPPKTLPAPRYSRLADLDYLYADMGLADYAWFQLRLHAIVDLAFRRLSFSAVIARLKSAFPLSERDVLPVDELVRRLESIEPGMSDSFKDLSGPSTIDRVTPTPCGEAGPQGASSVLVVRNDTGRELPIHGVGIPEHQLGPGKWRAYRGRSGVRLELPGNQCLVFNDRPRLAVLTDR